MPLGPSTSSAPLTKSPKDRWRWSAEVGSTSNRERRRHRAHQHKRAVVPFSPRAARPLEERPELDFIRDYKDGSADYALQYTDPDWAAIRVMQHLGEAIVLELEELREEVYRQAVSLL